MLLNADVVCMHAGSNVYKTGKDFAALKEQQLGKQAGRQAGRQTTEQSWQQHTYTVGT